ncbi:MAG: DUF11 domain-containing protein [Chloroflexi bacterium]|nr:DUF11 domain-containing protein [Chloroflexota bacterium]
MNLKRFLFTFVLIVTLLVPATLATPRTVAAACDAATFIADVTIPDGSTIAPGAAMSKTWRLQNSGTCTWSTSYAIVFYAGSQMGAPSVVYMPTSVAPGATVDITVNMIAPTIPGHYRGYWMLRNAASVIFGVGPYGTWPFFIDIVVSSTSYGVGYDFVANYCSATWTSGAGVLPCPGADGSASGYVFQSAAPQLENGTLATMPGLIVGPQNVTDGYISGTYPAFTVQSGDRFQSIVSCQYAVSSCYVTFRLDYQIGSGPVYTFWSFREKTEGSYYNANIDLSSLAGQSVKFTLKVMASGSPVGDRVVWGGARISRAGGAPPSTPVSTCDRAALVADVTIPDGTVLAGGTPFVKTWRLQNVGTCTWTTSYKLVFAGGDYMGTAASQYNLPASVPPGGTIDLSVNLVAPITPGNFIGYWQLRNASGINFGVGSSGTNAFTVNINVLSSYASVYDFASNACSATWSSGAGVLPCPGTDGNPNGFVLLLGNHLMEDGIPSTEGLLTFPQYVTDGYIQGLYPEFAVQSGDHFQSYVGCQNGGPASCYVIFRLSYQIGAGPITTLKTASERLENLVYRMDVDLSALAGQNVKFILTVQAFGSPSGDRAVWSAPRIVRSSGTPPTPTPGGPTATPTATIVGPYADLSVTITDGASGYTPGTTTTYTIVVTNNGPQNITGGAFSVTKPTAITSWTVSCVPDAGATCTAGPVTTGTNISDTVNLPAGTHVTYTVVSTINASAVGNLVTTASITNPAAVPDPNLANNSATDTDSPPSADLAVTKTDGISVYTPGGTTTYTIVVTNNGPLNVVGATFNDPKPTQVTSWTWICTPDPGAACNAGPLTTPTNFSDVVNIPAGKKIIYTVVATLSPAATGNLVNTASVTSPVGTPDPLPANNSATDTDTGPSADLSVTKTDGVTWYTPGGTLTYTIRVANNGPQAVLGAVFADNIPAQITSWTWTCLADLGAICTAGPATIATNYTDTVSIPSGKGVTYTVVASVSPAATGNLVNTATITSPASIPDPITGNNSVSDTDTSPSADLSITKTDGVTIYPQGATVTYTIVVTNNGPADVTGVTINDAIPGQITSWIWTCVADTGASCNPGPVTSGVAYSDTINLPAGKKVTYTVVASVSAAATGTMTNTATLTSPITVPDPVPGNDSATDTDEQPSADLGVTKTDMVVNYTPGGTVIYTIEVTNAGPSIVTGVVFTDNIPAQITSWTWTCAPGLGATCTTGPVTSAANYTDVVSIPVGQKVTYTVVATISGAAVGPMVNTATITSPALIPDPNPANNSATDIDTP